MEDGETVEDEMSYKIDSSAREAFPIKESDKFKLDLEKKIT